MRVSKLSSLVDTLQQEKKNLHKVVWIERCRGPQRNWGGEIILSKYFSEKFGKNKLITKLNFKIHLTGLVARFL